MSYNPENQKILYVEDFEPAALTFQWIAEELGHSCTCVSTAGSALELIHENRYDVIFLDINLPDMPGDLLAEALRHFSAAPIIGFTGDRAHLSPQRAKAFDRVESKTFGLDEIREKIRSALSMIN